MPWVTAGCRPERMVRRLPPAWPRGRLKRSSRALANFIGGSRDTPCKASLLVRVSRTVAGCIARSSAIQPVRFNPCSSPEDFARKRIPTNCLKPTLRPFIQGVGAVFVCCLAWRQSCPRFAPFACRPATARRSTRRPRRLSIAALSTTAFVGPLSGRRCVARVDAAAEDGRPARPHR